MYEQIKASKQKVEDLVREQNQLKERLNNQEDETRTKLAEKEDHVRKLKNAIEEKEWVEFDKYIKTPQNSPGCQPMFHLVDKFYECYDRLEKNEY